MADTFRLARSAFIKAPPATIHALVNDFHQWEQWSPWVKMDAGRLSQTYEGPSSGVGAGYTWAGPRTGKGRMEILTSTPAHIGVALDFIAPMRRSNKADFTFTPEGDGTKVEWVMTGPMGLVDKIMQIFISMEKMVGPSFEQGLAGIKSLAEAAAPKAASTPTPAPVAAPNASATAKAATAKAPARPAAPKPKLVAKASAEPKPAAAPKAVAKTATKAARKAPTSKAPAKAAPVKTAGKAKPAAKAKAPTVKAPAKSVAKAVAKPAIAEKPAAKTKPAAKPKAPTKKS